MEVIKKEKQTSEIEVIVEEYNICDKCDARIINVDSVESYECKFIYNKRNGWGEYVVWDDLEMELCRKCADELVAILKGMGYRFTESKA